MTEMEIAYIRSMAVVKRLVKEGIITTEDAAKIEEKLADKYNIENTNLYRVKRLI